jgi:hypothetical protein
MVEGEAVVKKMRHGSSQASHGASWGLVGGTIKTRSRVCMRIEEAIQTGAMGAWDASSSTYPPLLSFARPRACVPYSHGRCTLFAHAVGANSGGCHHERLSRFGFRQSEK